MLIREIQKKDNLALAKVIRLCLEEFNAAVHGTMYTDPSLNDLYSWFDGERSRYWVVEVDGKVAGGSGLAPLPGGEANQAELQRMFLAPEARGTGAAKKLMGMCLEFAQDQGFETVYLETLPQMHAAQNLYRKFGFEQIDEPMGCTGHGHCDVHMRIDFE